MRFSKRRKERAAHELQDFVPCYPAVRLPRPLGEGWGEGGATSPSSEPSPQPSLKRRGSLGLGRLSPDGVNGMTDVPVVAIDGPAAAGKTVIGRALAMHFGWSFFDTGVL